MMVGVHHIALATRDLDRMIDFYTKWLGFDLVSQWGWSDAELIDRIVGHSGSSARGAMLKLGGAHVEMFQYSNPSPGESEPGRRIVSEPGYQHIALTVSDIDDEYERLKPVIAFNCPPIAVSEGGTRSTYGRDPDGNVIELVEYQPKEGDPSLTYK